MKRRKPINADMLRVIEPLTENQKKLFESYDEGKNLIAYGVAGTGKTFISLYKALCDVFNPETPYEKIYIVRSLVATREIGFLPGDHEDKAFCIKYLTRIWLSICLRWPLRQTLKCYMVI